MNNSITIENWSHYVGHRCLIEPRKYDIGIVEAKVLEVSPNGRVKFHIEYPGVEIWRMPNHYLLIEDLGMYKNESS